MDELYTFLERPESGEAAIATRPRPASPSGTRPAVRQTALLPAASAALGVPVERVLLVAPPRAQRPGQPPAALPL
eukprot:scaffold297_cov108-Isochrysis_galbana.AAC.9